MMHCERHITSAHSGFGFRCTECFEIFSRRDQKHSCKDHRVTVVKRATGTYTEEEKKKFLRFQKSRVQHVKPFMQEIKTDMYPKTNSKKRTICVELPSTLYKKKKRVSLMNKPGSTGDAGNAEAPTQTTETVGSPPEVIQQLKKAAVIVLPAADHLLKAAQEVPSPNPAKEPVLTITIARRRHMSSSSSFSSSSFSSSSSNSSSSSAPTTFSKSKDPLLEITEEITTPYTVDEVPAPIYTPTKKNEGPLNILAQCQTKRIVLNVGGKKFETSTPILTSAPNGLLADMVAPGSPVKPYNTEGVFCYFIYRNPRFFDFILDFLRDPSSFHKIVSTNRQVLRQIHVEADYYRLPELCEIAVKKSMSALWED